MGLSDYKEIVGTAASVTTIGQQFAPVFMIMDVVKLGTSNNMDATPFIGGLVMCTLTLQYGLLLDDSNMITVNIFGLILNIIYFSIYYVYNEEKANLHSSCSKAASFVVAMISYAQLDSKERAEFYFGLIITALMFLLISAPLFSLKEIIATKSSAKLPAPLIISGTVVTFLWLLYGIIIENIFIQIQNVVAFVLCTFQLSLIIIYPKTSIKKDKSQ